MRDFAAGQELINCAENLLALWTKRLSSALIEARGSEHKRLYARTLLREMVIDGDIERVQRAGSEFVNYRLSPMGAAAFNPVVSPYYLLDLRLRGADITIAA